MTAQNGRGSVEARITWLLPAAILVGLFLLPHWAEDTHSASRKADERTASLERELGILSDRMRGLDARLVHVETFEGRFDAAVERLLPADARWLELRGSSSEQWDFPVGGRIQVQFLRLDEDRVPLFHVVSRAVEVDVPLKPGFTLRAVDDLGDERRIHLVTLHRVRTDRSGRLDAALVSAEVEIERD